MMMYKIIVAVLIALLSGCSNSLHGSVEIKAGGGEFRNKYQTKRVEVKSKILMGDYHLSVKAESLKSYVVDDPNYSLIDANNVFVGAGITKLNTELTVYAGKDYWQAEMLSKSSSIYRGIYSITGIRYLNRYQKGRKTTSAIIGLGKRYKNKHCEITYTVRNNTAVSVDDYLLLGCGVNF